jgi:hypothetical protein
MGRRAAVAFFLGDVGFLADSKFRALARRLRDPDDFNSAVGAYWIALAASRRNGSPDVDARVETDSGFIDDLVAVGLLSPTGFPQQPWNVWAAGAVPQQSFAGKARAASAERGPGGRFGPAASSATSVTSATSALEKLDQRSPASPHGESENTEIQESGPTTSVGSSAPRPKRRAARSTWSGVTLSKQELESWRSFGPEWAAFRDAWINRGLRYAPFGSDSADDTTQRGLLWSILDAQPVRMVAWITDAPGKSARDVIGYVLERWHELRDEQRDVGPDTDRAGPSRLEAPEILASVLRRATGGADG